MAGPWEKYQSAPAMAPAVPGAAPWEKFRAGAVQAPQGDGSAVQAHPGPAAPPPEFDTQRALQVGVQGAGRGVADILGAPSDIATAIANTSLAGTDWVADKVMGDSAPDFLDYRFGPSALSSDSIAGYGGDIAEHLGMEVLDPEAFSPKENLAYNVNRYGSQAGTSGTALARHAARKAPGASRNMMDLVTHPYSGQNAPRALTGDVASGAGSGAGLSLIQDRLPQDDPLMQALAEVAGVTAGGFAGGAAGYAATSPGRAVQTARGFGADPSIPITEQGRPELTQRRTGDAAARVLQEQASDLPAAQRNLEATMNRASQTDVPAPTPSAATQDPGLIAIEQGWRSQGSQTDPAIRSKFDARDTKVREGVAEGVRELSPAGADQPSALAYAKQRPNELADARDAAALPILQQAEASGAVIDATPVVTKIDGMLGEAKRQPVRKALEDAKASLNKAGGDELDDSLTGLYESRKAINDIIQGRTETPTGRYAKKELMEVRDELDRVLETAVPEFGDYMKTYRSESRNLDVLDNKHVKNLVKDEKDLRNVARKALSPSEYGTELDIQAVNQVFKDNPEGMASWKAAVSDVLADRVTRTSDDISYASLRRVYNQNRDALAEVYDPAEMKKLDDMQNLLQTVERVKGSSRGVSVEGTNITGAMEASLLMTGHNAVTVGMIMKRVKIAANMLGLQKHTIEYKTSKLLDRAAFDPELYSLLLERSVADGIGPAWNKEVLKQIRRTESARQAVDLTAPDEEGEDDELIRQIQGDE